jgi:hypothetical protein
MTDAVDRHRAADQARSVELGERVAELEQRMYQAGERAGLTRLAIALRWESVLDALLREEWMRLRPLPEPSPDAAGRDLAAWDDAVDESYQALLAALHRPRFGLSRPGRREERR